MIFFIPNFREQGVFQQNRIICSVRRRLRYKGHTDDGKGVEIMNRFVHILNRLAKIFWGAFKESPGGFFVPLVAFWHAVKTNATPQRHYDEGRRSHIT